MTAPADSAAFLALPAEAQRRGLTRLAHAALSQWDVRAQAPELIKHRENAVFKVMAPGGGAAVLRVHRQGYHSDASLRSELAWSVTIAPATGWPAWSLTWPATRMWISWW